MKTLKSFRNSFVVRSGSNAHRYICFINGKLRSFQTSEKDIDSVIAELFGSLNSCFSASGARFAKLALTAALPLALAIPAQALPTGYQSVSGNVQFSQPNANTLNVTTSANRSVVNYQSFNVWRGETVNFLLPGRNAAILNRVIGGNPSQILGSINSNGQVFIVNPSGIIFGSTAQVNVGSLFASTMNITNQNFLNGNLIFQNGGTGAVVNEGMINIDKGGYAILAGSAVENTGTISAPLGQVHLAVGGQLTLNVDDGVLVDVTVDEALAESAQDYLDAVRNAGTIDVDGGLAKLQAKLQANMYERAVNNEGRVQARSVEFKNGVVEFTAEGGNAIVQNTGTVDVSGTVANANAGSALIEGDRVLNSGDILAKGAEGGVGGDVRLLGDKVSLVGEALVDASGDKGGGQILVGGDYQGGNGVRTSSYTGVGRNVTLDASAGSEGDGGKVVAWSDDATVFLGTVDVSAGQASGNGGFAEVSGAEGLVFDGEVDASAPNGEIGTLLLDPRNITIVEGAPATNNNTELNDNAIEHANGGTADFRIGTTKLESLASNVNVELQAKENIFVQDLSTSLDFQTGAGKSVTFRADADVNGTGGFYMLDLSDRITTQGGDINIFGRDIYVGELLSRGGHLTLDTRNSGSTGTIFANRLTTGTGAGESTLSSGDIKLFGHNIYQGSGVFLADSINLTATGSVRDALLSGLNPTFGAGGGSSIDALLTAHSGTRIAFYNSMPASVQLVLNSYSGGGFFNTGTLNATHKAGIKTHLANNGIDLNTLVGGLPGTEVSVMAVSPGITPASTGFQINANSLSVNAVEAINLTNASSDLTLNQSTLTNQLQLKTAGNLTVAQAVTSSSGKVDLQATNDLTVNADVTGTDVSLTAGDAVTVGDLNLNANIAATAPAGIVNLTATGDVLQDASHTHTVKGNTLNVVANGDVKAASPLEIDVANLDLDVDGDAELRNKGNVNLLASEVGGNLSLETTADATTGEAGDLTVAGAVSAYEVLLDAANDLDVNGTVTGVNRVTLDAENNVNLNALASTTLGGSPYGSEGLLYVRAGKGSVTDTADGATSLKTNAGNLRVLAGADSADGTVGNIGADANPLNVEVGGVISAGSVNGDINILANNGTSLNVGSINTTYGDIALTTSGAGGIVDSDPSYETQYNVSTSGKVTLKTASGNIGAADRLEVNASTIEATTDTGNVNLYVSNYSSASNTVTLGNIGGATAGTVDIKADTFVNANPTHVVQSAGTSTNGQSVVMNVDGDLDVNGSVLSDTALNLIASGNVVNDGVVDAGTDATLDAGKQVINNGTVDADGNVKFEADSTLANAIDNNNTVNAGGTVDFLATAGGVDNSAAVTGAGLVKFNSGADDNVKNTGAVQSTGGRVRFVAGNNIQNNVGGNVTADKNVVFDAGNDISNSAVVTSQTGDVNFEAEDDIGISSTGQVLANQGDVNLLALDTIKNQGKVKAKKNVLFDADTTNGDDAFHGIQNTGTVTAEKGNITFDSQDDILNTNTVEATKGTVTFTAVGDATNSGASITAGTDIVFDADNISNLKATSTASLRAKNNVSLTAKTDIRNKGEIAAEDGSVTAVAVGDITNDGGSIIAGTDLSLDGDNISNLKATSTPSLRARQNILLTADNDIVNQGDIEAEKGNVTAVAVGDITNDGGNIIAGTDLSLDGDNIYNSLSTAKATSSPSLRARQNVLLTAKTDIMNEGEIKSNNGQIALDAGNDILNISTGEIIAEKSVSLNAGRRIKNDGLIKSKTDNVTLHAVKRVKNNGEIHAGRNAVLKSDDRNVVNTGLVDAENTARLKAGKSVKNTGTVKAKNGNVVLKAGEDVYNDGTVNALSGKVKVRAGNDIINDDTIKAESDVSLKAGHSVINNDKIKSETGNLKVKAKEDVTNAGTLNAVSGSVNVVAGDDIFNEDTIKAGTDVSLIAVDRVVNRSRGSIQADNNVIAVSLGSNPDPANFSADGRIVNRGSIDAGNLALLLSNGDVRNFGTVHGETGVLIAAADSILNRGLIHGEESTDLLAINEIRNGNKGQILGESITGTSLNGDIVNNGQIGDNDTENVFLTTLDGGDIIGNGLTSGENITLDAVDGNILFNTNATNLKVRASGDAIIDEANSVNLDDSTVGGTFGLTTHRRFPGIFDPHPNGTIQFTGTLTADGGYIRSAGSILDNNFGDDLVSSDDFALLAGGGTIASFGNPLEVDVRGGDLFVGATGSVDGFSVVINGKVQPGNTLRPLFIPPGAVLFNGQYLFGGGPIRDLLTQGLPALFYDYNYLIGNYQDFDSNDDVVNDDSLQNVVAEIINRVGEPQPFDLRFIEEEGEDGQPVLMLMMAE